MRSGGDAGTAIHTSVPFGIAARMASVLHWGEGIDRRRVESHRSHKKVAPGCLPGATSGEVFGRKHADLYASPGSDSGERPRGGRAEHPERDQDADPTRCCGLHWASEYRSYGRYLER